MPANGTRAPPNRNLDGTLVEHGVSSPTLVIGFERAGDGVMNHLAHIGAINAHPEGVGGGDSSCHYVFKSELEKLTNELASAELFRCAWRLPNTKTKEVPMRILFSLIFVLGLLAIAGCQPIVDQSDSPDSVVAPNETVTPLPEMPIEVGTPPAATTPDSTPDRIETPMNKTPERVPQTEEPAPVTGEVPLELLDLILKDLTARTGAAPGQVSVIRTQAVVWNDGSLGCPQPGMVYTQALVKGYWVELEISGKKFDYRASDTGYFLLCESGFPPSILPVTPDS